MVNPNPCQSRPYQSMSLSTRGLLGSTWHRRYKIEGTYCAYRDARSLAPYALESGRWQIGNTGPTLLACGQGSFSMPALKVQPPEGQSAHIPILALTLWSSGVSKGMPTLPIPLHLTHHNSPWLGVLPVAISRGLRCPPVPSAFPRTWATDTPTWPTGL